MAVHPAIREHVEAHLTKADFALRVAAYTECVQNTPAHDHLKAALEQVARARAWVKEGLPVAPLVRKVDQPPLGQGLPLTRKDRLGHRWE